MLPTEPAQIDAARLAARLPKVVALTGEARRRIFEAGLASEVALDAELANKRLALVLGGAAGSGYVFLGALERLEQLGHRAELPRGLQRRLDPRGDPRAHGGVSTSPSCSPTSGGCASAAYSARPSGRASDCPVRCASTCAARSANCSKSRAASSASASCRSPVDVLATGLGPGALSEPSESYARVIDLELHSAAALGSCRARRSRGSWARSSRSR